MKKAKKPRQLLLPLPDPPNTWGGRRKGAGRPRTRERPGVPHTTRPAHHHRHPLHVTLRIAPGLPSLRARAPFACIRGCLRIARERFGLRVNHFVVLGNHMHLVVEAEDRTAITRGLKGLCVRMARALNKLWDRKGAVFGDRYHERVLRTPREVKNALAYVLKNALRHGIRLVGLDGYSSAASFDGWKENVQRDASIPVVPPRTWLQRLGWRRHGPIPIGGPPTPATP